jgi:hypothetical protein
MVQSLWRRGAVWLAPVSLTVAACNGTGPRASHPLSLSVTTRSATAAPTTSAAAITVGSGANSLTLSKVQVVLARIELGTSGGCAPAAATPPAETQEQDCDELQAGPALVDLPTDGTTKVILDGVVPAGTYSKLRARLDALHQPDEDDGPANASAFLTVHPDFKGISVKVTGSFTDMAGTAHDFTFTSEVDAEIEAAFATPVTVGSGTSNVTIDVDVASWFKDAGGAVIDPTNSANAEAIARNIRQSFKAFEDDNHDGADDHDAGQAHQEP